MEIISSNLNEQDFIEDNTAPFLNPKFKMGLALKENRITDIRAAVKDQSRANVFIDNKFRFSLTISQIVDLKLKVGQILTDSEIEKISSESDFGKFFQRVLEYVLSRPHSEKEIHDHLINKKYRREAEWKRYETFSEKMEVDAEYHKKVDEIIKNTRNKNKNYRGNDFIKDNRNEYTHVYKTGLPSKPSYKISDQDILRAMSKLRDMGLINDENFAKFYVSNRNVIKGISEKKLKLELKKKGVSSSIVSKVFLTDEFGEKTRDDITEIRKIIEKKRRLGVNEQKLTHYLVRQGFPYDLVKTELAKSENDLA